MFSFTTSLALKVLCGSLIAAVGFSAVQTYRLDLLKAQGEVAAIELRSCGGRLEDIILDLESDNEISLLPDSALIDVPDHWLRDGAD